MLAEATRRRYQSAAEVLRDLAIETQARSTSTQPNQTQPSRQKQPFKPFDPIYLRANRIEVDHQPYWTERLLFDASNEPGTLTDIHKPYWFSNPAIAESDGHQRGRGLSLRSTIFTLIVWGSFLLPTFVLLNIVFFARFWLFFDRILDPPPTPQPHEQILPPRSQPSSPQPQSIEPDSTLLTLPSTQFLGFTPEGNLVNVGDIGNAGLDPAVQILDPTSNAALRLFPLFNSAVAISRVALSPDGKLLAVLLSNNAIEIRDLQYGYRTRTIAANQINPQTGDSGTIHDLVISPDGKTLIVTASNRLRQFWNLQTGELIKTQETDGQRERLALSSDGKVLISVSGNQIDLRNQDGNFIRTIEVPSRAGKNDRIIGFDISSDNRTLITASSTGLLYVWNLETGRLIQQLADQQWQQEANAPISGYYPPSAKPRSIAITPDGKFLFATGIADTILVWNLQQEKLIQTFAALRDGSINTLILSPDGKYLVIESGGKAEVWSVDRLTSSN